VEHDVYLKPKKCNFEKEEVNYLGIIVGGSKVQMNPKKLKGVADYQPPTTPMEVWKFLGFTGYYQYFILNYSKIAQPLLDLTKKTTPWPWGKSQSKAFEELKMQMCQNPILVQLDFNKHFYLQVDASAYGVGAILLQEGDPITPTLECRKTAILHPIAYYLATFTPTKQNYDIYERELLAIMKALVHWQAYLGWTKEPFVIHTDHTNLQYWKAPHNLNQ
jgi:hypothetical protein